MMTTEPATAHLPLSTSSPSFVASIMGLLVGSAMVLAGAYFMLGNATSMTLNVAMIVVGLIEISVSFYTLRASRVAWAFALSTNGTASVVLLFSAPRIRDATDISLGLAIVPCILFCVILVLYTLDPKEF